MLDAGSFHRTERRYLPKWFRSSYRDGHRRSVIWFDIAHEINLSNGILCASTLRNNKLSFASTFIFYNAFEERTTPQTILVQEDGRAEYNKLFSSRIGLGDAFDLDFPRHTKGWC